MMDTTYKAMVEDASWTMTAREKLRYTDLTDAIQLDEATQSGDVIIDVDKWAVINVHNEKSDTVDYMKYVIIDKDEQVFVTGSESFWKSFVQIYEVMSDEGETTYSIKVYRRESKNYKGKDFITCRII
jgi:hypothetical protein